MCSVRLSVRTCGFHPHKRSSILLPSTIVKCYQGIVIGRYDYAGATVRGTHPDITVIRLSVLATLLTNRHDNTKLISLEQLMLWRVHPQTVNLIPLGKQSWFDSKLLHQFLAR